jgi:hypothetical protein
VTSAGGPAEPATHRVVIVGAGFGAWFLSFVGRGRGERALTGTRID